MFKLLRELISSSFFWYITPKSSRQINKSAVKKNDLRKPSKRWRKPTVQKMDSKRFLWKKQKFLKFWLEMVVEQKNQEKLTFKRSSFWRAGTTTLHHITQLYLADFPNSCYISALFHLIICHKLFMSDCVAVIFIQYKVNACVFKIQEGINCQWHISGAWETASRSWGASYVHT